MSRHSGPSASSSSAGTTIHPAPSRHLRALPTHRAIPAVALALLLVLLGSALSAPALADGDGSIQGRLVNRTPDAPAPAGLDVTLYTLRGQERTGMQTQKADSQGEFRFDGLSTDPSYTHVLVVEYQNVSYFQVVNFGTDPLQGSSRSVEIPVYESTTSAQSLKLPRANWLVASAEPGVLTIMEMGSVANTGDRTIVSPGPNASGQPTGTMQFTVPRQAVRVTPQFGLPTEALQSVPGGFQLLTPITPGEHEFAFTFQVPTDSSTVELAWPVSYPIGTFTLMLPESMGLLVASPSLMPGSAVEIGGRRWETFQARDLRPGDTLVLRLSGLPAPPGSSLPSRLGPAVLIALAAALMGVLGLTYYRRRAARLRPTGAIVPPQQAPEGASDGVLVSERDRLLAVLAELDEARAACRIPEEEYASRRAQVKERLLQLTIAGTSRGGP